MRRLINKAAIDKVTYDSSHISVLSYHTCQLKEEGTYIGYIIHKDTIIDDVKIIVSNNFESMQANIDFSTFDKEGIKKRGKQQFELAVNGCLLLFNKNKNIPFQFKLEKPGKTPRKGIIYDTKKLNKGDIYACVLLRPGLYEIVHKNNVMGNILIEYPTRSTNRSLLNEPVRIQIHDKSLKSRTVKALPMQGIVFEFETSGSVQVNLKEEDKPEHRIYSEAKKLKKIKRKKPLNKKFSWKSPAYNN